MELLTANNVWMMICTGLVFFMHLGFTFLESGMTQKKNTVNILFKNFFVITMGLLVSAAGGFNLMYPGDFGIIDGWLGFAGAGLDPGVDYDQLTYADGGYTYWTDFLFQGMFAATAATIVSGAVAERIKLGAFMLYAFLLLEIIASRSSHIYGFIACLPTSSCQRTTTKSLDCCLFERPKNFIKKNFYAGISSLQNSNPYCDCFAKWISISPPYM